ncbi:hypothetical protein TruAng_001823 [Truncatella angustata]|nr:hypothetical protein TruAng_001823 [Truncatella angustata]
MPSIVRSPSRLSTLPRELRVKIIASVTSSDEIPRAWFQYRLVSKSFKDDVEDAFRTAFLKRLVVYYPLYHLELGLVCLELNFEKISGDRVVFSRVGNEEDKLIPYYEGKSEEWSTLRRRHWERTLPQSAPGQAGHFVILDSSIIIDSELPALEVNYRKLEILFQWKQIWNNFCGELQYISGRLPRETNDCLPSDNHHGNPHAWDYLVARRARWERTLEENCGMHWSPMHEYVLECMIGCLAAKCTLTKYMSRAQLIKRLRYREEHTDRRAADQV